VAVDLSPLPDIWQVLRPAAGDDEHRIDPNVVAFAHVARREPLSRNCDASETVLVERESGCVFVTAGFYLDESERAAATRNDIDLASRYACPPRKDAPAPKP
jgi:hypothetical protein